MRTMLKFRLLCTALMVILSAASAAAFGLSQYATQSKLATGKWVKISIPETGMYEITYDELRAMGFNNPSQVRLYGNGGYAINEKHGIWRNNTMVVSDSPDEGKYMFQGEGYKNQIDNQLQTGMHVTTVHNSQYPRSNTQPNKPFERKTATVGKQLMAESFKSGMYFATYVGHAGSVGFTKFNSMWVTSDVANTSYRHFPIMSTACCDVAHFDCMVHQ